MIFNIYILQPREINYFFITRIKTAKTSKIQTFEIKNSFKSLIFIMNMQNCSNSGDK